MDCKQSCGRTKTRFEPIHTERGSSSDQVPQPGLGLGMTRQRDAAFIRPTLGSRYRWWSLSGIHDAQIAEPSGTSGRCCGATDRWRRCGSDTVLACDTFTQLPASPAEDTELRSVGQASIRSCAVCTV